MDHLTELLEAYDKGVAPFHQKSDARDLYKELSDLRDMPWDEDFDDALTARVADITEPFDEAWGAFKDKIEENFPAGAAADIVALLIEHLPKDVISNE